MQLKSAELINIAEVIKICNVNIDATERECWGSKSCSNITYEVLNYLISNTRYVTRIAGGVVNLNNMPCSNIRLQGNTSLTKYCEYGARCNVCGFRVCSHISIDDKSKDVDDYLNLYDSKCIVHTLMNYYINTSLNDAQADALVEDLLKRWCDTTVKYYAGRYYHSYEKL